MDITRLVYRSQATRPLSAEALQGLVGAARKRNAAAGLTGLLVVDGDRFVQWLEGPAAGLEPVWHSIRRDARHQRIEWLPLSCDEARIFPDWGLQLGLP